MASKRVSQLDAMSVPVLYEWNDAICTLRVERKVCKECFVRFIQLDGPIKRSPMSTPGWQTWQLCKLLPNCPDVRARGKLPGGLEHTITGNN